MSAHPDAVGKRRGLGEAWLPESPAPSAGRGSPLSGDRLFDGRELAETRREEAESRGIGRTTVRSRALGLGGMPGGGASRKAGRQGGVAHNKQKTSRGSGTPPEVGRWDFRGGGLRGRDLYTKTGSRVPGEGFRGGGVGHLRRGERPNSPGPHGVSAPHRGPIWFRITPLPPQVVVPTFSPARPP